MYSFPNLLVIGAMKSGTTSLHDYLDKHPDVFMSDPKEIHYYSSENKMSESEYLSHFRTSKKIRGTSPQSYSKSHYRDFKGVAKRINEDTPDVKLIYIVRDPFERMRSHALENRYGDDLKRMKDNLESGHYWKTSLYHYQISEYLRYFKKSQIHVLTLEELQQNKLEEMNKIFKFLGVSEMQSANTFAYRRNEASSKELPNFIKAKVWYRVMNKINRHLAEKIASKVVKAYHSDFLIKPTLRSLIDKNVVEVVREDAEKLKEEFSIDITLWNLAPSLK